MKTKIIFIFTLHLIILASYITITSWLFVTYPVPDPIATGLQQSLCLVVHFSLTVLICLVKRRSNVDRKKATTTLLLHVGAMVCWVVVYLLLSNQLADYLWELRSK